MEVRDLLIGVKALLVDASHWTQEANARSRGSADEVEPWDSRAHRWCLYGACAKVCGVKDWRHIAEKAPAYGAAIIALRHVSANDPHHRDPLFVNDVLGHAPMLDLLDRTIKHVEASPERYTLPVPA